MHKNIRFHYLLVLLMLGLFSCESEPETPPRFFYGNYNLQSVTLDTAVDLNNDALSSNNFLEEIDGVSTVINTRLTLVEEEIDEMVFSIFTSNVLTTNNNVPIIRFGSESVRLLVAFDELSDTFEILNNSNAPTNSSGEILAINLLDQLTLELEITKSVYDYGINDWVEVQAVYRFVRGGFMP